MAVGIEPTFLSEKQFETDYWHFYPVLEWDLVLRNVVLSLHRKRRFKGIEPLTRLATKGGPRPAMHKEVTPITILFQACN